MTQRSTTLSLAPFPCLDPELRRKVPPPLDSADGKTAACCRLFRFVSGGPELCYYEPASVGRLEAWTVLDMLIPLGGEYYTCRHLENGKCRIYWRRPSLCSGYGVTYLADYTLNLGECHRNCASKCNLQQDRLFVGPWRQLSDGSDKKKA